MMKKRFSFTFFFSFCMKIVIFLIILAIAHCAVARTKPYKMSLLDMMVASGVPAQYGPACRAAAQIVIDIVNDRSDILPDYFIEPQFEDEKLGTLAASLLTKYSRSYEGARGGLRSSDSTYQSPIVVGPFYSDACKSIGPVLHHMNLVALSTGCGAVTLANRALYPNLYLMYGVNLNTKATVHFAEEVGEWKRIGLITTATNILEMNFALAVQQYASERGVAVPAFMIVMDVDEAAMLTLKARDIRVIVYYASPSSVLWKFFCLAFKYGLTGPRYTFIVNGVSYTDPAAIPSSVTATGCARETILYQYKFTIWVTQMTKNIDPTVKSEFGYDSIEFEAMLTDRLNFTIDYAMRFQCHDTVLKALLALDYADRKLKAQHNLSLINNSQNPSLVMKIVNQSVLQVESSSLRLGRVKYNQENGQLDSDVTAFTYWTPGIGLQPYFAMLPRPNATNSSYSSYYLKTVNYFQWFAWPGGNPPRDGAIYVRAVDETSFDIFVTITVLAGFLFLGQIVALFATLKRHKKFDMFINPFSATKCLGYFACMALDGAAIAFAAKANDKLFELSIIRIVLLAFGLSATHTALSLEASFLWRAIRSRLIDHRTAPIPGPGNTGPGPSSRRVSVVSVVSASPMKKPTLSQLRTELWHFVEKEFPKAEKRTVYAVLAASFGVAAYLAIWLDLDRLNCTLEIAGMRYFYEIDTYVERYVSTCSSKYAIGWMGAIAGVNVLILAFGLLSGYQMTKANKRLPTSYPEVALLTAGLTNAITLLLATVMVLIILKDAVSQNVTAAFASLLSSAVTSTIWFFPLGKALITGC